jgi:hypothetical protein
VKRHGRARSTFLTAFAMVVLALAVNALPAAAAPPTASVNAITDVSYTSAHLEGTVNPGDHPAYWLFQYSTDATNWNYVGDGGGIAENAGPTPVEADLTGLQGGTKYYVRLFVFGEPNTTSPAPYDSFTTLPVDPPSILSVETESTGNHSASVSGSVERPANPNTAFDVTCRFEYITDTAFQPRNEKQRLIVRAGGGTFTLSFANPADQAPETTAPITYNATAAAVQSALQALPDIGAGNVTVTGGPGNKTGAFPYTITFTGSLAAQQLAEITADPTNLTEGGEPATETTTLTEGHPEGFEGAAEAPCRENPLTTAGAHPVTARLTGLEANTTYHLRLSATNAGGTDRLVASNFTTASEAIAQTLAPEAVRSDSAILAGRVNAENSPVTYQFKWGTTESYGNVAPVTPEALATVDEAFHVVTAPLTGLQPSTVYHYRLVVTNTDTSEVVEGEDRSFETKVAAPPAEVCPNEASRVGSSAGLPDCRAIEFASPGLNNAGLIGPPYELPKGAATADGSGVVFMIKDAPLNSESASMINITAAEKAPGGGWLTRSMQQPIPTPETRFAGVITIAAKEDRTEWISMSTVPPSTNINPPGLDGQTGYLYLHHADGTWERINDLPIGNTILDINASANYKHFFFGTEFPQYSGDPGGVYEWSVEDHELRHPGVLPDESLAADAFMPGGPLNPYSSDGEVVLFIHAGQPYLRIAASETREIAASQRTPEDPVGPQSPTTLGVTADGSQALFISKSELTEDANTGYKDAGADLYSYDVAGEELIDLTADDNPADADTGANVLRVLTVSPNADYVYFVATGKLATGGVSGEENLYVEHEGVISFIAPAEGLGGGYATPAGNHLAFTSTASLTGYDNVNPTNNNREAMAFEYTYGGGLECASCRLDGTPPVGSAVFPVGADYLTKVRQNRVLSDDGSRLFFQSTDKVVPQAANQKMNVFEYTKGEPRILSPGDTEAPVFLLDASASGDDVFITANEELAPGAEGTGTSIYDVRVNADVVVPSPPTPCSGENCREGKSSAPELTTPATAGFEASDRLVAPKSKKGRKGKLQLRIYVPAGGQLRLGGKGLKAAAKTVSEAQVVTIAAALRPASEKTRRKRGLYKTTADVLFTPNSGNPARASIPLRFEGPRKRGGK